MEARLFACLSTSDLFKHLSCSVPDPEDPCTKIRKFYVFCRGTKTPTRYKILNAALVHFSTTFVQLKFVGVDLSDINVFCKAQYQPNSCAYYFRCLFATLSEQGIRFTLSKSFNGAGMYVVVVYIRVCVCRSCCVSLMLCMCVCTSLLQQLVSIPPVPP